MIISKPIQNEAKKKFNRCVIDERERERERERTIQYPLLRCLYKLIKERGSNH